MRGCWGRLLAAAIGLGSSRKAVTFSFFRAAAYIRAVFPASHLAVSDAFAFSTSSRTQSSLPLCAAIIEATPAPRRGRRAAAHALQLVAEQLEGLVARPPAAAPPPPAPPPPRARLRGAPPRPPRGTSEAPRALRLDRLGTGREEVAARRSLARERAGDGARARARRGRAGGAATEAGVHVVVRRRIHGAIGCGRIEDCGERKERRRFSDGTSSNNPASISGWRRCGAPSGDQRRRLAVRQQLDAGVGDAREHGRVRRVHRRRACSIAASRSATKAIRRPLRVVELRCRASP